MASEEEEAFNWCLKLDIDYVFVIFGGLVQYKTDDIAKFGWMPKIAAAEFPHMQYEDYRNEHGMLVSKPSKALKESLIFKLSYYRNKGNNNVGKGFGYDRSRNQIVVNMDYI